jgi:uncharacterized small protein (DUF1192 family)
MFTWLLTYKGMDARIAALESEIRDLHDDGTEREEKILQLRNENARMKAALEKARDENARILAGDLVVGPACWECPNSLHIYESDPGLSPTVICRRKIRCKSFEVRV